MGFLVAVKLHIGEQSWLSPGVLVHTHVLADIKIGNFCDIGLGVEIMTSSHEIGPTARRACTGTAKSVFIGNGTWIGAKSIILGGVTIGDGCVVAAGSRRMSAHRSFQ